MARMFYTLQETAEKLGVDEDKVKGIASDGKLQQFRDGNRLMFKRDQVDGLAEENAPEDDDITLEETGDGVPMADSGDTDQIDLADASKGSGVDEDLQLASGTGISVFDADEVDLADPSAKTEAGPDDLDEGELALESVSSGSGLLDLTRESDDTSLGAELLEEIYPGGEGTETKVDSLSGSALGSLETGFGMDASSAGDLGEQFAPDQGGAEVALGAAVFEEPYDGGGDGMSVGLLIAATTSLVIALIVAVSALFGVTSGVVSIFAKDSGTLLTYLGILLGGSIVFGVVGMFVGKALAK